MGESSVPERAPNDEREPQGSGCAGIALILLGLSLVLPLLPFVSADFEPDRGAAVDLMLRWWPIGLIAGMVFGFGEAAFLRWRPPRGTWSSAAVWPIITVSTIFVLDAAPRTLGALCGFFSGFLLPYALLEKRRRRAVEAGRERSGES